ncbi:MAG: SDR family NAD(P)-dependent oxidoreductase [Coprococcus sp.]|nr:SDR family NAD(P)-dependent oxidoreductase [Coprococcus sp.]
MRIAIVTGASSGIGREFVRQIERFYKELDEIWVIARREERLQELKKNLSTYVRIFAGDLQKDLVYKQVLNRLENQNPDIRMLVNAAGFGKTGTVEEIAAKDRRMQPQMAEVNCCGLTEMICLCLPYMSKGSRIINVASAAAFCPQPRFAVYAATKAYVLNFSRGLGEELKEKGMFVTAVCPGPVDTEFFEISGTSTATVKECFMARPEDVVRKALIDSRRKKELSVYGKAMKGARIAAKIIPHRFLLRIMGRLDHIQFEKNREDTEE